MRTASCRPRCSTSIWTVTRRSRTSSRRSRIEIGATARPARALDVEAQLIGWIDQRAMRAGPCRLRHAGGLDTVLRQDVEDAFARREQIVGDDATMAAPPHRLGAHDRAPPLVPERAELRQAGAKRLAHRVVGVVVEALILPAGIHLRRYAAAAAAQAAERRDVDVVEAEGRERGGERLAIVLRIAGRARHRAHVHDQANVRRRRKRDELLDRARRVTDGEEWLSYALG